MFFFFFKQKTAYEMLRSLVGSEMCIRDSRLACPKIATGNWGARWSQSCTCLLYTSDAADDLTRVDLGGRRITKKKNSISHHQRRQPRFVTAAHRGEGALRRRELAHLQEARLREAVGGRRVRTGESHRGSEPLLRRRDRAGAAHHACLLYTSDAADDLTRVDLGGRRIIKKKK